MSLIEVESLAFAYPDGHQALFGVNLAIEAGESVALLGPNGAGKTTLALHLVGILAAGAGEIRIAGRTIDTGNKQALAELRRSVGIVFQDPDDQLFMPTVLDDVMFGPRNLGAGPDEAKTLALAALESVGMADFADRAPHHLSFGQRRRVALASVLSMQPTVLVLDEPSSNLDPASRRELAEILRSLDITLIMVTHDLPFALELCERSLILSGGVIAADAPTADVLGDAELMAAHRIELPFGFDLETALRALSARG